MAIEIVKKEIYKVVDGTAVKIETIEEEVEVQTAEELIAEKEAKLLELYEELKQLKGE